MVTIVTPILEEVAEITCTYLEVLKGTGTKKVMLLNQQIQELQAQIEPIDTSCIGFQVSNQDECEDDWGEEEDKIKIGFR